MLHQVQDFVHNNTRALCILGNYKVDYFVTYSDGSYPPCVNGGRHYQGNRVYSNPIFNVYNVETEDLSP